MASLSGDCDDLQALDSSDSESSGNELLPKKRKLSGAFQYKTKFNKEWQKSWPVSPVPGDPHSFKCNVCTKNLSCGHQGVADIKDHCATKSHLKLAKGMSSQISLTV